MRNPMPPITNPNKHSAKTGSILLTIMVILFALSTILGGVLTLSTQYFSLTQNRIVSERALYAAEAGLEKACAVVEEDGIANYSGSGTLGDGSFDYKVVKDGFYECNITATGTVDGVTRILKLTGVCNASYAAFSFWTDDNGTIYFATGDHFSGRVHTGTKPYFTGSPEFEDKFTSNASTYGGPGTNDVTFGDGFEYDVGLTNASEFSLSDMETFATTNTTSDTLLLTGATEMTFADTLIYISNDNEGWDNYAYTISDEQLIYIESGYITVTSYETNSVTTYTTNGTYTSYATNSVLTYTTNYVTSYVTNTVVTGTETVEIEITLPNGKTKTRTVEQDVYGTEIVETTEMVISEGYTTVITSSEEYDISSSTDTDVTAISTSTEWSDGTLELNGGTLDGRLTIVTEDDIFISGSLEYALDPLDTNAWTTAMAEAEANGEDSDYDDVVNDALGLVSGSDVVITTDAPDDITLYASIMAIGDGSGTQYGLNSNTEYDGCFVVDEFNADGDRGYINLLGGITQGDRGPVGLVSGNGYSKNYEFDERFSNNPPPYFPTIGEELTFKIWEEIDSDS